MKYNKLLASSKNPENLSLTIKGILLALVPIIIFIAQKNSVALSESEIVEIINAIAVALTSVMIILGLARKIFIKFGILQ